MTSRNQDVFPRYPCRCHLLIAALSASGTSEISNIDQIDRGYQHIDARLKALGAEIERV